MGKIKIILCDFDGVMVNRFTELSVGDFCSTYNVNRNDFNEVSKIAAEGLDTGAKTEIEYFSELTRKLSLTIPANEVRDFFIKSDANNIQEDTKFIQWLTDMKRKGIKICLATNVSKELAERLSSLGLYNIFDNKYFSYEISFTKTDDRFWDHVLKNLAVNPELILFIDDNEENTVMAAKKGLKTILYKEWDSFSNEFNISVKN